MSTTSSSLQNLPADQVSTAASLTTGASPPSAHASNWSLDSFQGRLAELSGGAATATLTLAFRLVLAAQEEGEPVAWVTSDESSFFPPDAAAGGIDLDAFAVIRVPRVRQVPRAADLLVRSGGFGLVVLDLGRLPYLPMATQTRLAGLAKKHRAAVLLLTEKSSDEPSLGPLVSLRAEATRAKIEDVSAPGNRTGDRFRCAVRVLKDKRHNAGWHHQEVCRAPDGLC